MRTGIQFANLPPSQSKLSASQASTKSKEKGKEKEQEIIDVEALEDARATEASTEGEGEMVLRTRI